MDRNTQAKALDENRRRMGEAAMMNSDGLLTFPFFFSSIVLARQLLRLSLSVDDSGSRSSFPLIATRFLMLPFRSLSLL